MQPCDTVDKCPFTSTHLMSSVTLKDNRVITLYTQWTTPSVSAARYSSTHTRIHLDTFMVTNSEAGILDFLKGFGWWATDSKVCKQMTYSYPQTRMFYQTWPTAGHTACSVNGESGDFIAKRN